jgi:hypothetical protein
MVCLPRHDQAGESRHGPGLLRRAA